MRDQKIIFQTFISAIAAVVVAISGEIAPKEIKPVFVAIGVVVAAQIERVIAKHING